MTLKEKFLKIETYEEFDKRREEFRGMGTDKETLAHMDKIFGTSPNPNEELYKSKDDKWGSKCKIK